jgi:hypothetical protein
MQPLGGIVGTQDMDLFVILGGVLVENLNGCERIDLGVTLL